MLNAVAMAPHKMQSRGKFAFKQLPELLHNRVLVGVFIMSVLFATAHYTCYSYIEPFLGKVATMSPETVTLVLIVLFVDK